MQIQKIRMKKLINFLKLFQIRKNGKDLMEDLQKFIHFILQEQEN